MNNLRSVKSNPKGVAVFQVMPDAFAAYLEARKLADEIGVPATWEFLRSVEFTSNVPNFEVQRFAIGPPPGNGLMKNPNAVTIAPIKKMLD